MLESSKKGTDTGTSYRNFHIYELYYTNRTGNSRFNIVFDVFGREKGWQGQNKKLIIWIKKREKIIKADSVSPIVELESIIIT